MGYVFVGYVPLDRREAFVRGVTREKEIGEKEFSANVLLMVLLVNRIIVTWNNSLRGPS